MMPSPAPEMDTSIVLANLKEIAGAVMRAVEAGTPEGVLERIAEAAQRLVNARYVALGIPDGDGHLKYFKVVGVTPEEIKRIGHPPVGRGLLGIIMNERHVLRLEDMADHPRSVGFPAHHPAMTSLLGVPIQLGQELYGMLYMSDRRDNLPFSDQDQWLAETLAGYAALAIAGSQLREQHGRLILLEERERVGRELHDGIIQSLYAIGMQLQLMRLTQDEPDDNLGEIIRNLDLVIGDIRSYILNLKVANYERQTIQQCLEDAIARLHLPDNLEVVIDSTDRQAPFAPPVLEAVCQIAYEAVSNVARHARASTVRISAHELDSQFQLTVEDDGCGFLVGHVDHEGLGLRNIQQRARIHGGRVKISSAPGCGTRITLTLPLPA